MNLIQRICQCENLTSVETRIGGYVIDHIDTIPAMSEKQLEKTLFVSRSAIYRFCRKLGLDGFHHLKILAARESDPSSPYPVNVNLPFSEKAAPREIAQSLGSLYAASIQEVLKRLDEKTLQQAASMIIQSRKAVIFTAYHNLSLARNFADKLLSIGYEIQVPSSREAQTFTASLMGSEDIAICISYSGQTPFLKPAIAFLQARCVPVLLISSSTALPDNKEIACRLYVSGRENIFRRLAQFSSDFEILFLLDCLYGCILNANRGRSVLFARRWPDKGWQEAPGNF